ncbi:MAG: SRPBCC family protein [Crocinitomicaceae bacterium]|nr:SRPBCC family protein [Crocinitomicaceae bacterium]
MALYQIKKEQKIPVSVEELWEFISSPRNLAKITPEKMRFEIKTKNLPEKVYPGLIITYKVRPIGGIKMTWVTEITHVSEFNYFVDEQRKGPYKLWHHEHHIIPVDGGVLMKDVISYIPPFGFLGRIANKLFIQKQLNEIFEFREKSLENIFGHNNKVKVS